MASQVHDLTNRLSALPSPWSDANLARWEPGRSMERHRHDFLQVIHVVEGVLEIDWGAGWVAVGPGQVHVLPPGHHHALRSPRGQAQFGLNAARRDDGRGLLAALCEVVRAPVVIDGRGLPVDAVRAAATAWPRHRQAHLAVAVDSYALALLDRLAPAPEPVAQRLYAWLHEHQCGPIAVPVVARRLGTTRVTLQRACHVAFGCGVSALHERMRIAAASEVLLAGADVAAAAAAVGYSDPTAFTRAFRRVHGLPPTRWRNERRARLG
jgi:AraC-like DNA-binding protein